ncbi:protein of unknown function [Candidatus Methylomirabilis oxygeniifera]|uniref:Uncharacterized protein n=1 Tax=Methylomirabilis oxygeniifera TaxID=671143 RepID=D5MGR9_METO1|nr:protein of unknown function [Candidatus Methylomirabilis oxyfera]
MADRLIHSFPCVMWVELLGSRLGDERTLGGLGFRDKSWSKSFCSCLYVTRCVHGITRHSYGNYRFPRSFPFDPSREPTCRSPLA